MINLKQTAHLYLRKWRVSPYGDGGYFTEKGHRLIYRYKLSIMWCYSEQTSLIVSVPAAQHLRGIAVDVMSLHRIAPSTSSFLPHVHAGLRTKVFNYYEQI